LAQKKAQKKVRAKDLKKQRWAGIIAAILAIAMILSVAVGYFGQAIGGEGTILPEQQADPEPEDYLAHYQGEVERLEEHLEEHEATEIILRELAENYRYLTLVQQMYFDDQEAVQEYQEELLSIYQSLVEMEPADPMYRLELINLYVERQKEQHIDEEISALQDLLREDPDPMVHISLIGLLDSLQKEDRHREEVEWLHQYLEDRIAQGIADNEERFYNAVLLGEYLNDPGRAESVLEDIMEEESEESRIYQEALNYLNHLQAEDDLDEEIFFD